MTNDFFVPTGSPVCRVCGDPTDGTASLPTDDGGRVHRACHTTGATYAAWDLIGYDGDLWLQVVGGRTLYDTAMFNDSTPGQRVRLDRLDTANGLRVVNRYVDADTPIRLVP